MGLTRRNLSRASTLRRPLVLLFIGILIGLAIGALMLLGFIFSFRFNGDGNIKVSLNPYWLPHWARIVFDFGVFVVPSVLVFIIRIFIISLLRRNARLAALAKRYNIEEEGLGRGPQTFKYKLLSTATKGFNSNELLGTGGFGSVYKGKLVLKGDEKPTEIAVKRISTTSNQGAREFLTEVKILGQVQHRNLVRVLGWCCEVGELMLVYDYIPNGSVDQHIHRTNTTGELVLTWTKRLRIVSGVATALAYLHEECEQRIIHRDVKSSNVMLDRDFNPRLGDFGLARISTHDQAPESTFMAGTYGYLAPELPQTLKPTEKTDVYSFGALVLEVATGKKPLLSEEDHETLQNTFLVDWVWSLYKDNHLLDAADCTLQNTYDPAEMTMLLKMGLLCCHPNPDERPKMREVINIWKGSRVFPPLPSSKPVAFFAPSTDCQLEFDDNKDGVTTLSPFTANFRQDENWAIFAVDSDHEGAVAFLTLTMALLGAILLHSIMKDRKLR